MNSRDPKSSRSQSYTKYPPLISQSPARKNKITDEKISVIGAIGGFVLFLYGIVLTFQKTHFHRVYAAYGGVFIVMSVFWGWLIDEVQPDNYDIIGTVITVIGVLIIFYYPRKGEKVWQKE